LGAKPNGMGRSAFDGRIGKGDELADGRVRVCQARETGFHLGYVHVLHSALFFYPEPFGGDFTALETISLCHFLLA
jgi:hypothetical protein